MGNLVFRGGSQNFNVSFAKAARVAIVEAEEIVPTGAIAADDVDLPGVFVTRVVPVTVRMDVKNLPMRVNRPADSARRYLGKPALTREGIGRRGRRRDRRNGYLARPRRRAALCLKMPGLTSSRIAIFSK